MARLSYNVAVAFGVFALAACSEATPTAAPFAPDPQMPPEENWAGCIEAETTRLAAGSDTPQSIADQVLRACAAEEDVVRRDAESGAAGISSTDLTALVDQMRADMRVGIVSAVEEARK